MTKGVNKPNKPMRDKPGKPINSDKQRGISVIELLFAASTIGAAVLVMHLGGPKLPPTNGD